MKRKTIDLLTTSFLMGSMAAAVPAAIYKPAGPVFIAWIIAIFLAGLWELGSGAHKKFLQYQFSRK